MRKIVLSLINIYRRRLSSLKGAPCCRYFPSCSNYAYRAVNEWGCIIGLTMAFFRIVRCNPLFKGGYRPVPRRRRKLIPKTAELGRGVAVTEKTADLFGDGDVISVALMRSIAPVNPKTGNYVPLLTRMERYLYSEEAEDSRL